MRKWHRWASLVFFLPILFIALTGVASQFADIYAKGGLGEPERAPASPRRGEPVSPVAPSAGLGLIPAAQAHEGEAHEEEEAEAPAPPPAANAGTLTPGDVTASNMPTPVRRPPPTAAQRLVGTLHHLHSGESFGPAGTIISILSGIALIFFAISGMWMYLQMFLARARRTGRKEAFWK